ncbi:bifunctional DnaQ family exonuclease/ATP-dependent helicase [Streptococcus sp. X16XC17]|uniref:bifunctional DnaQ family exonuclease/ATP-dependent helicase n=1 Tax=unclassified Streptococcus TaxID=2608887 RepID=UPI00066FD6D3|nr:MULTISPECIES: bifunctional DnaQ family exonuclease/ATP-dependent helicase [unclassified Streptococcus]TCD46689.1 bifunctional DnaQ family exonuclease/ATP-dependent helicase [Streptococcus sp. X16XC17]
MLTEKIKANKYAVIDLEATGTGSKAKIIQIGIVIVQNGEIMTTFESDINPYEPLDKHIKELTGITDEQLAQAPDFGQVVREIYDLIGDAVFVAHNVKFDANLLAEALFFEGFDLLTPRVDTVELAQVLFPTYAKHNLGHLTQELGIPLQQAHTAIADAMATAQLFLAIQEKILSLPKVTVKQLLKLGDSWLYESRMILDELYPQMSDYLASTLTEVHGLVLKNSSSLPQTRHLSEDFSKNIALLGLDSRKRQESLACMVEKNLKSDKQTHFIQAQAGIGKTYGYLLPLLARTDQPILVSLPTKALQQQIMENEGLKLQETFNISMESLKSARHFIKLDYFWKTLHRQDENRLVNLFKMQILVWLTQTETGDMDELKQQYRYQSYFDELKHDGFLINQSQFAEWDFWVRLQSRARQSRLILTNHAYFLQHLMEDDSLLSERILVLDEVQRFLLTMEDFASQTIDVAAVMQGWQRKKDKSTDILEKRLWESSIFELDQLVKKGTQHGHYEMTADQFSQLRQNLAELNDPDVAFIEEWLMRYDQFWLESRQMQDKRIRLLRGAMHHLLRAQDFLKNPKIFCISATLELTSHLTIADLLGFEDVSFDKVENQSITNQLLIQPSDLPDVLSWSEADHAAFVATELVKLASLNKPTLVLFSSISLMLAVSDILEQKDLLHLAQHRHGDEVQLKKRFEKGEVNLLLGTGIFWQGIDFAKQDKVLAVIVRLPFDHPKDRLTQKINHHLRQSGKNPFYDYSLPMMLIRLKQAIGRTNRSRQQRSVVVLLDPRMVTKQYGQQISEFLQQDHELSILPLADVKAGIEAFFKRKTKKK